MTTKKKTTTKAPKKSSFTLNTRPKLVRMAVPPSDPTYARYNYELAELWTNDHGSVIANAGCDDVFICDRHEIPDLITFLQSSL